MSELRTGSRIPPLENEDFLEVSLGLIIDSNVRSAFMQLQSSNPRLAREVLLAAHYEHTNDLEHITITDALRGHINIIKAIERALSRETGIATSISAVVVEGSQPSGELPLGS